MIVILLATDVLMYGEWGVFGRFLQSCFLKPVDDVEQVFAGVTFVFNGEHASCLKDGGFGFPVEIQQAIAGSVVLFCGSTSVEEFLDDGQ